LRSTPILLLPRRSATHWTRLAPDGEGDAALGSRAQRVADYLGLHGASFFDEIVDGTRLLSTELEDALSELVARGRAHCDSFGGLRALLVPASKRPSALSRKRRRVPLFGIQDAGRWALVRARSTPQADDAESRALIAEARRDSVEHIARQLLQRYGVVAWRLLEREAAWLPPWRELVRVYQRLEARGEIRGGRFIDGLSGEQFALPEAIGLLREMRRRPHDGCIVSLSASDPANLLGSVLPGERVPRVPGNRVLFRDGVPIATWVTDHFNELVGLDGQARAAALAVLSGREGRLQALMAG
jgi:ATP-dependent Lhr-like helicase